MAVGQYYIDNNDDLYYDDGNGFEKKGNVAGLPGGSNPGAPVDSVLPAYLKGVRVDPITKKPLTNQPDNIRAAVSLPSTDGKFDVFAGQVGDALRYPEELTIQSATEYLLFDFWRYKPNSGQLTSGGSGNYSPEGDSDTEVYEVFDPAKQLPSTIIIAMPQDIGTQIGAQWGGKSFGFLGKGVAGVGANIAKGTLEGIKDATSGIGDIIRQGSTSDALKSFGASLTTAALNSIPGVGGNLSVNDIVQGGSSKILNPNVELMYEGPTLRELSLKFKLVARTSTESKIIKEIATSFRKAAAPANKDSRFINLPAYVRMRYMRGGKQNQNLPKHRMFAINGVDVNYTPDGQYIVYEDGYVPSIEIGLALQETKIIFFEDIANGY